MGYVARVDLEEYRVGIEGPDCEITVNGLPRTVHLERISGESLFSLLVDARPYEVYVERGESGYAVTVDGDRFEVSVTGESPQPAVVTEETDGDEARASREGEKTPPMGVPRSGVTEVKSPLTGVLVELLVEEGHSVAGGQSLAVLEAMKMQNDIKAPCPGVVEAVMVAVGDALLTDTVIMCIAPEEIDAS